MPYKWRATYNFDYPLLDKPVDIEGIVIYPTPPDNDIEPSCVHYYEFETDNINKSGQEIASSKAKSRLEELIEISVLAPYRTEIKFHSLILLEVENQQGFPTGGINFDMGGGKPYFAPGQNPEKIRNELFESGSFFRKLRNSHPDIQAPIGRSLRWFHRACDHRLFSDEKLIYGWISFNSLYSLYKKLVNNQVRSERNEITIFENEFRGQIGILKDGAQLLANAEIELNQGQNRTVSQNLKTALANNDPEITHCALECVYAVRCSLFHGAEKPVIAVPNSLFAVSSRYLNSYLNKAIKPFIKYCANIP